VRRWGRVGCRPRHVRCRKAVFEDTPDSDPDVDSEEGVEATVPETVSRLFEKAEGVRRPEPPLPEASGLTLEEYLAMQRAIGHPTRFRILRTLVANDELSATHLKSAVDVGLVEATAADRRQPGVLHVLPADSDGCGILEHGVEELMGREREFDGVYS